MQLDREPSKLLANRLARFAFSRDGTQLVRLLRLMGLVAQSADNSINHSSSAGVVADEGHEGASSSGQSRVGIWAREQNSDSFVRRLDMIEEWGFWANVGRIDKKRERKRVVLIGESAARGYFYDPLFSPTMVLQGILDAHFGKNRVEVLDLARTNLGFEVVELAASAVLLEPDAVVIFSGNNWNPYQFYSRAYMPSIEGALCEGGIPQLKCFISHELAKRVKHVTDSITNSYKQTKIPLVWIIPEFNLADWRDPVTNAPHLSSGANEEWILQWEQATTALKDNDIRRASASAERMVELDREVTVAGLYILAECSRRLGDLKATRDYLERARDCRIWDQSMDMVPRVPSITQNTLREEGRKNECYLVDLPKLFHTYLGGALPDRRLFLDYCHLTAEGIRVAMAATASAIIRSLLGEDVAWKELLKYAIDPGVKVKAQALFVAAVHGAHRHQCYDLIQSYCMEAIHLAPSISEAMACFVDLQSRRTPMLLCKAAETIAESEWSLIAQYLLRFNNQQLDSDLIKAIISSMGHAGIEVGKRVRKIWHEEHAPSCANTDLLDFYYCSSGRQPQEVMWAAPGVQRIPRQSHYYKAYWKQSRFVFVGKPHASVYLQIECRVPNLSRENAACVIEINGTCIDQLLASRQWKKWTITVPEHYLGDGLNEILIHWPDPAFPGSEALRGCLEDLQDEALPEFYYTFAEIHSLTMSTCNSRPAAEQR